MDVSEGFRTVLLINGSQGRFDGSVTYPKFIIKPTILKIPVKFIQTQNLKKLSHITSKKENKKWLMMLLNHLIRKNERDQKRPMIALLVV